MPKAAQRAARVSRTPLRQRGRPKKTRAERQLVRDRILGATREVFIRKGYHGLSVDAVLTKAKLSRPTFYKYFRKVDEPIEILLREGNEALVRQVLAAVEAQTDPALQLEAAFNAWMRWGAELGPLLEPLFAELHDRHSPVSRYRLLVMTRLGDCLADVVERSGRSRPSKLAMDTLLHTTEYLGYRYHRDAARDAQSWEATRAIVMRMALCLLGTPQDFASASEAPTIMGAIAERNEL